MKKITTIVSGVFFAVSFFSNAFGQSENNEISETGLGGKMIMTTENYKKLDPAIQERLANQILVVDDFGTTINSTEKSTENNQSTLKDKEIQEKHYIKNWLGSHPNLKIITHSHYNTLNQEQIEAYQQVQALFLNGEEITMVDIYNYPH